MIPTVAYQLEFIRRTQLAGTIWQYDFRPSVPIRFVPGQYAHFSFPFPVGDSRGAERTMTLTSLPTEDVISFVTRFPAKPSVFKRRLCQLTSGDTVRMGEPLGDVVLPRTTAAPLVFTAGGIGIASYIAMLRDLHARGEKRTTSLLYAMRSCDDKIFSDLLHSFPFALFKEYISPRRLTAADILTAARSETQALYYLSGTESFVMDLRRQLEDSGLDHSRIVFDYFTGY